MGQPRINQKQQPVSVRNVPKMCHNTIQIVQEDFTNNTLRQERRTGADEIEDSDRDLNYLRSLLTLVSFLHKFLISNYEARLMEVAYMDTKEDIDFVDDHKEKVLKAIEESNLTGFLLPHLQKLDPPPPRTHFRRPSQNLAKSS